MLDGILFPLVSHMEIMVLSGQPKEIPDVHIFQMFALERIPVGNTNGK